jgi:uncharacterized YccA/Bax inhibitor family protein
LTWTSGVHHRGPHHLGHLEEMTMASNNPAFGRGFARAVNGQGPASGQGYAGWGTPSQQQAPQQYGPTADPYAAPSPYATPATRFMTMDDVVTKTGISFLVTVLAAAVTWALPGTTGWALAIPAVIAGFVLAMVISFKVIANPAATLAYAALEGVFLGAVSEAFDARYPGIVIQAVVGTFAAFAGTLAAYKFFDIKVGNKFRMGVIAAMFGMIGLGFLEIILGLFGTGLGVYGFGFTGFLFSLAGLVLGIFMLILDFDFVENGVRAGLPERESWRAAFALTVSLVWIYTNLLRLLAIMRR